MARKRHGPEAKVESSGEQSVDHLITKLFFGRNTDLPCDEQNATLIDARSHS